MKNAILTIVLSGMELFWLLLKRKTRMTIEALHKFEAGILKKIIPVLHSPE